MRLAESRVERDRFSEVTARGVQSLPDGLDESGKIMRLCRLSRIAGARVAGRFREVIERARRVEAVIEQDAGNRTQHGEIGIVALLGFEVIVERFVVPAVQISRVGALAKGARFTLELRLTNLAEARGKRRRTQLGLPHRVAKQRMKVSREPVQPACQMS